MAFSNGWGFDEPNIQFQLQLQLTPKRWEYMYVLEVEFLFPRQLKLTDCASGKSTMW